MCRKRFTLALLGIIMVGAGVGIAGCGPDRAEGGGSLQGPQETPQAGAQASCEQATTRLQQEYTRLRACVADEDCNFIQGFYEVIPREDASRAVRVQDCKEVTPFLGVANGTRVNQGQEALQALREEQARACARPPGTFICQAFADVPSSPPPVCEAGRCRALPN